jgi:hypothetical protein
MALGEIGKLILVKIKSSHKSLLISQNNFEDP